jgi:undecaprenyl-diphosphatase
MLENLDTLDQRLFVLINQRWSFELLDQPMTRLSSSWFFIPLYFWAIFKLVKKWKGKSWIPLALLVIAFGLADSISTRVFKDNFKRLRPCHHSILSKTVRLPSGNCGGQYGFVSSHAANAFAVYPLIMLFVFARSGPSSLKKTGSTELVGLSGLDASSEFVYDTSSPENNEMKMESGIAGWANELSSPENGSYHGDRKWNKFQFRGFWWMILISSLVAYSRVYLGRHYVGDVLGGAILGLIIGQCIWKVHNSTWIANRMKFNNNLNE